MGHWVSRKSVQDREIFRIYLFSLSINQDISVNLVSIQETGFQGILNTSKIYKRLATEYISIIALPLAHFPLL